MYHTRAVCRIAFLVPWGCRTMYYIIYTHVIIKYNYLPVMFVHCFGTVVWMASSVWNYFIQYTGATKQLHNYLMYTDRCYINCKSCMAVLVMFVHTLFWDCSMACTISNWDCVVCQITIETWDDTLSGHDDICTDLPWTCLNIALKLLLSSYKLYMWG